MTHGRPDEPPPHPGLRPGRSPGRPPPDRVRHGPRRPRRRPRNPIPTPTPGPISAIDPPAPAAAHRPRSAQGTTDARPRARRLARRGHARVGRHGRIRARDPPGRGAGRGDRLGPGSRAGSGTLAGLDGAVGDRGGRQGGQPGGRDDHDHLGRDRSAAAPRRASAPASSTTPSGWILTNYHVIEGNGTLTVTLNDGREFPGRVASSDQAHDLAVVKIDGTGFPTHPDRELVGRSPGRPARRSPSAARSASSPTR